MVNLVAVSASVVVVMFVVFNLVAVSASVVVVVLVAWTVKMVVLCVVKLWGASFVFLWSAKVSSVVRAVGAAVVVSRAMLASVSCM